MANSQPSSSSSTSSSSSSTPKFELPQELPPPRQTTSQYHEEEEKQPKGIQHYEFEILSWNAVGMWNWTLETDTCAICKNRLLEECIECQARISMDLTSSSSSSSSSSSTTTIKKQQQQHAINCFPVVGRCQHGYHQHCIDRWHNNSAGRGGGGTACPYCQQPWVTTN